jgi:hypothetical protein
LNDNFRGVESAAKMESFRTLKIVQKILVTDKTKKKMIVLLGVQKLSQTLKISPNGVRACG